MTTSERPRAVLYARVSSKEQEVEGYSVEAQQKAVRAYATAKGFEVVREFVDVESAKKAGRGAYGEMLGFVGKKSNRCRTILVEKMDRLSRNFEDFVALKALDVEIHFVKQGVVWSETAKASDKLNHNINLVMASYYSDNLSEETRKGMEEKAEQGNWPSQSPLGYRNIRGADGRNVIEPDPDRAPAVRRMFERFATGNYSVRDVADMARAEGFRSRKGARVYHGSVDNLLHNPLFKGIVCWKGKSVRGRHEPLVSVEVWERVQEVFRTRLMPRPRPGGRDFPYQGLVRCGKCGCSMTAEGKKGKYVYYHCTQGRVPCKGKWVRQEVLEEKLGAFLQGLVFDEETVAWLREVLRESCEDERKFHEKTVALLRAEQDRLKKRRRDAYLDKLDGRLDAGAFDELNSEWGRELEKVQDELSRHEAAEENYLAEGGRLLELASRAYELWSRQEPSEKRRLLNCVVSNCIWMEGELTAEYRQPFGMLADASARWRGKKSVEGVSGALRTAWLPE